MPKAAFIPAPLFRQASLPGFCLVEEALKQLSHAGTEDRGAVYTRREVVDFILDLVGYTPDQPIHKLRLLEPSFGDGEFLLAAVERLLTVWRELTEDIPPTALTNCIRAVELNQISFESTRTKLNALLLDAGIHRTDALTLIDSWLIQDDFLLTDLPLPVNFVVGNPPYIRQELIPDALVTEYRNRYSTFFDRADIYIPFIERSLVQLCDGGKLGFICADRWMKNRYGGPLRQLVSEKFHLQVYVDMFDTPAFQSNVITYPAIFIIGRQKPGTTRIARQPEINSSSLTVLASQLTDASPPSVNATVEEFANVTEGSHPWILNTSDQLALVRRLEKDFPAIEEAGCKVGIGVATGADEAFIGPFKDLDVEDECKLPIAMTGDILSGTVEWRGLGVVNPFAHEGRLVALENYPRLKRHLEDRKEQIAKRHIAQKAPSSWYRTIDRIYPSLARTPKLLIPDIKGEPHIVYEDGYLYPHHNLYYITSDRWNLRALQAILLSGIAQLFVASYSTRMRGGYLRFQAQYLRRIRLPHCSTVSDNQMHNLAAAAEAGDIDACNLAVFELYNLNANERATLSDNNSHN